MVQGLQIIKYDSNGRVREHAAHAHADSRACYTHRMRNRRDHFIAVVQKRLQLLAVSP